MTQDKTQDKWLDERLAYLRGLKAPSDQQRLLLLLADKPDRSADDGRKMAALIRAERAAERAQKARAEAARIIHAGKVAERKARDHALYRAAGLMILAGLVESRTGEPVCDRGVLLGGLAFVAQVIGQQESSDVHDAQGLRRIWKAQGDALLAASTKPASHASGGGAQAEGDAGCAEVQPVETAQAGHVQSVPIPDGGADGATLTLETLMERLDYGPQGRTATDLENVSTLMAQFGAQKIDEEIDRLKETRERVYPSTLRKALGG